MLGRSFGRQIYLVDEGKRAATTLEDVEDAASSLVEEKDATIAVTEEYLILSEKFDKM